MAPAEPVGHYDGDLAGLGNGACGNGSAAVIAHSSACLSSSGILSSFPFHRFIFFLILSLSRKFAPGILNGAAV